MKNLGFLAALTVSTALMQFALCGVVAATSSELNDAFSRLDALAEELDELQRALGNAPEAPSDSTPLPPPEAVPAVPPDDSAVTEELAREPAPMPVDSEGNPLCGSRREMAGRMSELEERYMALGEIIVAVNSVLPDFRAGLLDEEQVCTQLLEDEIDSAIASVEGVNLEPEHQVVTALMTCVDESREATVEEIDVTSSSIRLQRLDGELELLTKMTFRVTAFEQALLRGISKRNRLLQELGLFRQEIVEACE